MSPQSGLNARWLAAFAAFVGLLLLAQGAMAIWVIPPREDLVVNSLSPFGTAENIAFVKSLLPFLYLTAVQGIALGSAALASAIALLTRRSYALRMLVIVSGVLAVFAVVAIIMMPSDWDTQGVFLAYCGLLWWAIMRSRRKDALTGVDRPKPN